MDEVERERFLGTLRRDDDFRATVRRELLTEELLNVPQTVSTLVDLVAQQRQDFTALATDARHYLERTITLVGEGFASAQQEISGLHVRFDAVGARFEAMDARFEAMDARFEAVDARFDGVDARFDAVDARFDGVDARFTAIDAKFDQVDADLREIKNRLAS